MRNYFQFCFNFALKLYLRRYNEADVVMSVFCGTDEEMLDKPRVVAKSVLTVKAGWLNAFVPSKGRVGTTGLGSVTRQTDWGL